MGLLFCVGTYRKRGRSTEAAGKFRNAEQDCEFGGTPTGQELRKFAAQ